MAKSQTRMRRTKETSGTRGRSNTNKTSSRGSSNRRSAARVADNSAGQMQMQMSQDSGMKAGRSRTGSKGTARTKKNQTRAKSTSPKRTRSAR